MQKPNRTSLVSSLTTRVFMLPAVQPLQPPFIVGSDIKCLEILFILICQKRTIKV